MKIDFSPLTSSINTRAFKHAPVKTDFFAELRNEFIHSGRFPKIMSKNAEAKRDFDINRIVFEDEDNFDEFIERMTY